MLTDLSQNSDLFAFLARPENLENPYAVYEYIRKNWGVYISQMPPNFLWRRMYCLMKYSDVYSTVKSKNAGRGAQGTEKADQYQKRLSASITSKLKDDCIVFLDPPRHTKIRSLISKAMSPRMINNLKPHIEEIAYELLEDIKGKTEIELIKEFAYPLPVLVIAELLGVPDEDRDKLKVWAKYLVKSVDALPMSSEEHKMLNKAGAEVATYFGSLIAERRGSEGEDLITQLTKANDGGISLTSGELISNCAFLLIAGHETTMNLITNGTLALLTNPEQLEILRSDPKIAGNATEELLRYDSPVQLIGRVAYAPFVFGDVTVAEGEQLGLFLGAANRDPEVFTNPDQLDITRKELAHLAFGQGIHYCLGAPLGRLEGEIAFKAIFETFPNLKVKDVRHEYRPSFSMRELLSLRLLTQ